MTFDQYLQRCVEGGIPLYCHSGRAYAGATMDNGQPTPQGVFDVLERNQESAVHLLKQRKWLSPLEVELSELVVDMLDEDELARLARYRRAPEPAGEAASPASRRAVGRVGARTAPDRTAHYPAHYESAEQKEARLLSLALSRLTRAQERAEEDRWEFPPGDILWCRRTKPSGEESTHLFIKDEFGTVQCDCRAKYARPTELCVHEIARHNELRKRAENYAH